MTGLGALLKKELMEQYRTKRFIIVGAIFIFFGITTPLLLWYLPEILKLSGETMVIEIPAPTAAQSLSEFAGTAGQVGVLVAVLVSMGAVANEIRRGTAVMTLSKPVSRAAFVTAKLIASALTFAGALAIAAVICYFYTIWLIGDASGFAFLQLNLLLGLFLVFCLAVTLLFSCLFKSSLAAGGTAIAVIIIQTVVSSLPVIGDYLPGKLLGWGIGLLAGPTEGYWWALIVTVLVILVAAYLGQYGLKRREI